MSKEVSSEARSGTVSCVGMTEEGHEERLYHVQMITSLPFGSMNFKLCISIGRLAASWSKTLSKWFDAIVVKRP